MRALKILIGCASGARARVIPLGAWRNAAVEAQLAEPQGRGWPVRTMKIFSGRNTKTSGIEPRIVLRASAIDRCKLAVLLSARSAFKCCIRQARASVIGEVVGGVREVPFGGCNKGNNNRPLNQRLRGRMGS
jgi:hypothetical protein